MKDLLSKINLRDNNEPAPVSVGSIMYPNVREKEIAHSNILAKILDPKVCGTQPLQTFLEMIGVNDFGNLIDTEITTEKGVEGGRRIDILLTCGSNAIIIENKLNDAIDQPNQLSDYYNAITAKGCNVLATVYLPYFQSKQAKEKVPGLRNVYPRDLIEWLRKTDTTFTNSYADLLEYMNQANTNYMNAKDLQNLSVEDLEKALKIYKTIQSDDWNSAIYDEIHTDIKAKFEDVKFSEHPKKHCSLWFEDYKYWVEVWGYNDCLSVWAVSRDKLEIPGLECYSTEDSKNYYKNPVKYNYQYPSEKREMMDAVVALLEGSKK